MNGKLILEMVELVMLSLVAFILGWMILALLVFIWIVGTIIACTVLYFVFICIFILFLCSFSTHLFPFVIVLDKVRVELVDS